MRTGVPDELNAITGRIVEAAITIHRRLGPGLLESVYHTLLANVLEQSGLKVTRHRTIPFEFSGIRFTRGLCVDLLVDDRVVVEVKSLEKLAPVHSKQVLTYLRLLDLRVGLLVNFGGATIKEGLRRIVNGYQPTGQSPLEIDRVVQIAEPLVIPPDEWPES